MFEEYRGRVGTVDFTDASKAYFFPVGVPGLFRQYNAPADFVETANTIGLPRYAKQAVDQQFARWVMLHVQSNPLLDCTRPQVLVKGKPRCTLHVNPEDAVRLGLADGAPAAVSSRTGKVTIPVEVTDAIRPGVVSIPHGWGHDLDGVELSVARRHAGVNSNLLADETLIDPVSGNAVLDGIPVEVAPA